MNYIKYTKNDLSTLVKTNKFILIFGEDVFIFSTLQELNDYLITLFPVTEENQIFNEDNLIQENIEE